MTEPAAASIPPAGALPAKSPVSIRRFFSRTVLALLRLLWAMILVQSLIGSLMIVGWTYRLVRRSVIKQWWLLSGRQKRERFSDYVDAHPEFQCDRRWPNWILGRGMSGPSRWLGSLGLNMKLGLQALVNTWVVTLPACALWWLGWHAGWVNSFTKGYELSSAGPAVTWLGILLFIAVMMYLPMAQVRQAVTADWKSFYQFSLVSALVRHSRWAGLGLALLYSLISLPLLILKTIPGFFPQINPALGEADPDRVREVLGGYFFWCGLMVLAGFVTVRWIGGRIYASAALRVIRSGEPAAAQLSTAERRLVEDLALAPASDQVPRESWRRFGGKSLGAVGRLPAIVLTAAVWFSFVAQVFVFQFLTYHPVAGWLNQPLVQAPWFRYLPPTVANPWGPVVALSLLVLLALLVRAAAGWYRRLAGSGGSPST